MNSKLERRVVYSTPFFDLVAKSLGDGGEPYYAVDTSDYVSVVALTPKQQIVLVRHYRPVVEANVIELPSGHVDENESPTQACARELFEETGFRAPHVELLGTLKPDTGRLMNRMHCCFAADVQGPRTLTRRETGIEPLVCSLDEFRQIFAEGSFDHALQIAAICLAISLGKLPSLSIDSFGAVTRTAV